MRKEIIISGYGNVAKEFVKLVKEKREALREKYNLNLFITGIISSTGMLYQKEGTLVKCESGMKVLMDYAGKYHIPLRATFFSGHGYCFCFKRGIGSFICRYRKTSGFKWMSAEI